MSNMEFIWCGVCGREVFRHSTEPIRAVSRISSRSAGASQQLAQMIEATDQAHREMIVAAEQACAKHFRERHPFRLWLWQRTRWQRLMNRRWVLFGQALPYEPFDFSKAISS